VAEAEYRDADASKKCLITVSSVATIYHLMRLRECRDKRGLSLRTLAKMSGVHYVSLARIEAGELDSRLSTLLRVSRALKVSIAELVGEATPSEEPERRFKTVKRGDPCPQKGCTGFMLNKNNVVPFHSLGFEVKDGVRRMKLACSVCGFLTTERQH